LSFVRCDKIKDSGLHNFFNLTLYWHIETAEQQQYGDWYIGRWWMGCYIWFRGLGRLRHYNCLCCIKS